MALLFKKEKPASIQIPPSENLTKAQQAYAMRAVSSIPNTKERQFIENRINVPIHSFAELDSYLLTGCKSVWATFRACHITASVVTSTVFNLVKEQGEDAIESGPLFDLWQNPNDWDSNKELIYQWVYHMKLTGRAFWVKDELNSAGQPNNVYPLLPQHVILIPDQTHGVSQYQYRINGSELRFSPEEIIHFRRPHPMDPLKGLGDIEPSQPLYNDFINRNAYEENFLANGAQPSGILTYRGSDEMPADMSDMEDEEWGALKKWWSAEYSGKNNAGKTALLTGEWQYERLGLTQQEMSSIEREKTSIEQIFMNHGVPLSLAGWTNAANYATARQDEINFRKYEVRPLIDILVGKLNQPGSLVKNFDEKAELSYELSGLVDVEQVHKDYLPLLTNGGMTLNELRVLMGLEESEDENLDQFYGTRGQVPIEMIGSSAPDDMALNSVLSGEGDGQFEEPELDENGEPVIPEKPAPETPVEPGALVGAQADTEAGVAPISTEESATPQQTLNGAQIQALVALAVQVTEGGLPKDTAVQIIAAAFPFTEERAERILMEVMEGSAPPEPAPAPFGGAPPVVDDSPPAKEDEDKDDDPKEKRVRRRTNPNQ